MSLSSDDRQTDRRTDRLLVVQLRHGMMMVGWMGATRLWFLLPSVKPVACNESRKLGWNEIIKKQFSYVLLFKGYLSTSPRPQRASSKKRTVAAAKSRLCIKSADCMVRSRPPIYCMTPPAGGHRQLLSPADRPPSGQDWAAGVGRACLPDRLADCPTKEA